MYIEEELIELRKSWVLEKSMEADNMKAIERYQAGLITAEELAALLIFNIAVHTKKLERVCHV